MDTKIFKIDSLPTRGLRMLSNGAVCIWNQQFLVEPGDIILTKEKINKGLEGEVHIGAPTCF